MGIKTAERYLAMWEGQYGADRRPANYQRRDDGSHIFHHCDTYYEWWYFDASLTNGMHLVVTFHYRNLFLRPMRPSVQIFVYHPDGSQTVRFEPVPPEKAAAAPDYCHVRMGDNWVRDTGDGYELSMAIGDTAVRLRFEGRVASWKPGTGFNYKDEAAGRVAGWVVPQPHAWVTGELTLGGRTEAVAGDGYHDHNWGNYPCHETFRSWYWGRIHHAHLTVDYGWVLPREVPAPVVAPLLVAVDGQIALSTNRLEIALDDERIDPELGQTYAGRLRLACQTAGVRVEGRIDTRRIADRTRLPPAADWAQYYYRFVADYALTVEVDGEVHEAGGEMLHELILL